MHYTPRSYYLQKIKGFINTNLIKVIVGQRRVGKSFILFQLMDYIENGNIQRKHYDLFVMDMLDVIRDVCAIGIDQTNIIFDDFSIEI